MNLNLKVTSFVLLATHVTCGFWTPALHGPPRIS